MKYCFFCLTVIALFVTTSCLQKKEVKETIKPNIVFILADDLGYMDIGAYAEKMTKVKPENQFYETPNLNKLISGGVSFSRAYATPLCSSTRSSILTGIYAAKWGFNTATPGGARSFYTKGEKPPDGFHEQDVMHGDDFKLEKALTNGYTRIALPSGQPQDNGEDAITIAESLADYTSAFIGKWHLGGHGSEGYQPHDQGFEELSYFDAGGSVYYDWKETWERKNKIFPKMRQKELVRGKVNGAIKDGEYLTDNLTQQAVNYIDSYIKGPKEKPFFLYFNEFAVHSPLQAPEEDIAYFENKNTKGWYGHNNSTYAAMVKYLDESVGKIIDKLQSSGLLENTLIVFMSDNGGVLWDAKKNKVATTSNSPLKGGKAMVYEGGIRVPLTFYWKDKIQGGKWIDRPVDCVDLYPTLLDFAGYTYDHEIDGQSISSLLSDDFTSEYTRDTYYWHYPLNVGVLSPIDNLQLTPHSAIRKGDFKLIFDWYGRLSLYNIKEDFKENNNLYDAMPAKTEELFKDLITYLEENVDKRYWPKINPDYDPAKEKRNVKFIDLYGKYKSVGHLTR
jgi:arylsulfatase A-like enzyme